LRNVASKGVSENRTPPSEVTSPCDAQSRKMRKVASASMASALAISPAVFCPSARWSAKENIATTRVSWVTLNALMRSAMATWGGTAAL